MSDRFGYDHFTLYNSLVKCFDQTLKKMRDGYIEKPLQFPIISSVKANGDKSYTITTTGVEE
jgi:hypothetical protein